MQEIIILVDENDNDIGQGEKLKVHQIGVLHRAFSIFVFRINNGKKELLLQQRNSEKYHCGGLWTNTCCGHPRLGENVNSAANRRLFEEMLFDTELLKLGSFHYRAECGNGLIEHELDHVFVGIYNEEIKQVNPEEVQDYCWKTLEEIETEMLEFPEKFTPWFKEALDMVKRNKSKVSVLLSAVVN